MFKSYAYAWLTLGFFLVSFALHWTFGWIAFVNEQHALHQPAPAAEFLVQALRDTFENWQSEFLQLIWQVVGLAYFLYVGSPSSKENDDRMEAKVDELLKLVGKERGEALVRDIDERFMRHGGHARPHGHDEAYPKGKGE